MQPQDDNVKLTVIINDHVGRKSACGWEMRNNKFFGMALVPFFVNFLYSLYEEKQEEETKA